MSEDIMGAGAGHVTERDKLPEAVKAEWDTLRDEISRRDQQSMALMTGSITVATTLVGLFVTVAGGTGVLAPSSATRVVLLPILLYFVPFAIMLPALYLVVNNAHSVARIACYIRVCLEHGTGLRYEGYLHRFYGRLRDEKKHRRLATPYEESKLMFAVFVALGLMNAAVFLLRGDWTWQATVVPMGVRYLLLATPFLLYVRAARSLWGKLGARKAYESAWDAVVLGREPEDLSLT